MQRGTVVADLLRAALHRDGLCGRIDRYVEIEFRDVPPVEVEGADAHRVLDAVDLEHEAVRLLFAAANADMRRSAENRKTRRTVKDVPVFGEFVGTQQVRLPVDDDGHRAGDAVKGCVFLKRKEKSTTPTWF